MGAVTINITNNTIITSMYGTTFISALGLWRFVLGRLIVLIDATYSSDAWALRCKILENSSAKVS